MRLISSQSFQPTSPIQISFVPGRERDAERIAQAVGDDAAGVGVGVAEQADCRHAAPVPDRRG